MNNFFNEGSPYLSHPLLTEQRTSAEVDRIIEILAEPPSRVLDVGCGFGRHSVEFARRGCAVVGLDPSETMIAEAQQRAADAGVAIDFRLGTGDSLHDVAIYDLAICLFTTLGQQTEDGLGDRALLDGIHRSCQDGATVIVEVPERHRALAALVESEQLGPTQVTRHFDPATSIMHERFEQADAAEFELAYRLYSAEELEAVLTESGFTQVAITQGALVEPPPTFMTAIAQR